MKRMQLVAMAGLILIILIFSSSRSPGQRPRTTPSVPTTQTLTIERQVSTQQQINRYFHDIGPKLRDCWSKVGGKGAIALKYTYTKAGGRWVFNRVETEQSTLAGSQNAVALRCMQDSVRGTSFPVDTATYNDSFVLHWTWPVPFPTNSVQLATEMFAAKPASGGSSGCDGLGAPAKCFNCSGDGKSCVKTCVGYEECSIKYKGELIYCQASTACASGGPFGKTGGLVIY